MGILLDRLASKGTLVSDGAWGTMLQARGLGLNDCPEEWNLSHAEDVQAVAQAYAQAGSDIVLTNTFGGSRLKLTRSGHADQVREVNAAGASHSLTGVAGTDAVVAASVGPTGEFLAPLGTCTAEEMQDVFVEQIAALIASGVRAICVETMSAPDEAACAIRAAKQVDPTLDVIATFSFDSTPNGFRTMMGTTPAQAVEAILEAGADIVGSNCGNGIENMVKIAAEIRQYTDKPILIHANAGLPELVDGQCIYRQGPDSFASHIDALLDAGANIVGGCCGTTPDHITAIRTIVDRRA